MNGLKVFMNLMTDCNINHATIRGHKNDYDVSSKFLKLSSLLKVFLIMEILKMVNDLKFHHTHEMYMQYTHMYKYSISMSRLSVL